MNFGIDGDEDGEGAAFGDYDRDGDLDLIINQDDENELWRNNSNNDAYLMVRALLDVGDAERDAIGATAVLRDCSGNLVSGIREVNGGRGHGAQDPAIMHFGLANLGGPNATYVVEVSFVGGKMVHAAIVPSHIGGYQQIAIRNNDALNLDACQADLAVHKSSSPNPASPGQPITYTLVVSNLGPNRVTSLTLTDNLPAAIVPPYIYTAASGNYDAITGIWTHLDLAAGNTLTLTIVGTVDPTFTGTIVNTADVSPIGAIDPILDNNHDDTSNQSYIPQIMQPTPTVVPTASPSPQPTLTVSPVPTASPEPTATVSPVPSVSPEPTGTGSPTPTATVYDNDNDGEDNDDNNDYDGTTTASITGGAHPTATVPPLPVMRLPETGSLAEAQTDEDMGIRLSIRLMVTVIVAMWIIFRIWGLSSQINKPK